MSVCERRGLDWQCLKKARDKTVGADETKKRETKNDRFFVYNSTKKTHSVEKETQRERQLKREAIHRA